MNDGERHRFAVPLPPGPAVIMGNVARLYESLRAALDRELPSAIRLRHELHAHPELSGYEHQTAARVTAAIGQPEASVVAGTGRLVRIGARHGPVVAIRAELDALPLREQTGAPFAASGDMAHACGHDVHLAALAALSRAARGLQLPAALLAILQPREEGYPPGARDVIDSGALAAHGVQAVIGAHLQPTVAPGAVATAPGPVNAAADEFEITVHGEGGHASYPHLARDPVLAISHIVTALQQLVARRIDPTHAAVVTVGTLHAAGAPNIIPSVTRATGSLRSMDAADRVLLATGVREIAESVARAHGCCAEVRIIVGEPVLVNDAGLAAAVQPWLRRCDFEIATPFQSCGSDDFAYYSAFAPSLMIFVGAGTEHQLHSPRFLPTDESVAHVASAMLAGYLAAVETISGGH